MKRLQRQALAAALAIMTLTATGCVKAKLHRPENIEVTDNYSLAFIEFDDQGEPWLPSQLERTIDLIEHAQDRGKVAVVLFVHGWHNDASKREERKLDNNVEGFQRLLNVIQQQAKIEGTLGPDDSLIGVYVGWRGRSTDASLIKPLTFYSRRGAGQRVAGVGTTEAITRVMAAARMRPDSTGVVIGHSFGGMIVERALVQALIAAASDRESSGGGEMQPLADLVVLVNPASQSMEAKAMLSILERNRLKYYRESADGTRLESPLIVSVTSTSDTATGNLYPMALGLKASSKKFRRYEATDCSPLPSQKAFYKTTAGHNRVLHSHVVTGRPLTAEEQDSPPVRFELGQSINPQTGATDYSFRGEDHEFTIERLPLSSNDTPYWIMNVPPALIDGHSDIFTFDTMQLLRALLLMGGRGLTNAKNSLVQETGVRPIYVTALPTGEMVFIERSRRFYVLGPGRRRPLALACWPSAIDVSSVIGGVLEGSTATLISSGLEKEGKKPKVRTDLVRFDFSSVGADTIESKRIKSDVLFETAAGDLGHEWVYFTGDGALWRANLNSKKPVPERLIDIEAPAVVSELQFHLATNRLLALDKEADAIYEFDLNVEPIRMRVIADDLGVPVDISLNKQGILLVVDAEGRRVLTLDCAESCGAPEVFAAIDEFKQPNTATMDFDGNVWVGDVGAESIFGFDASGQLVQILDSLGEVQRVSGN